MKTLAFLTLYIISYVGDTSAPKSCVSLMPYTLVTPHYPPVCRPVLLLPTVLGRILDKKLAGWQGFQLCEPGEKHCVVTCRNKTLCIHISHQFHWSMCHLRYILDTEEEHTFLCWQISLFELTDHIFVCCCKPGRK